jgi:RNA polymerase sigma factor (sigma-70 family)
MIRPTFISLCEQTIQRVAARYGLQPQDRDDFAQDAWLGILTSLDRGYFDPAQGRLESWLFAVVRNRALAGRRRRWRSAQRVDYPLELLPGSAAVEPSQMLDRAGRIEAVGKALELLAERISPLAFAVFRLRQLEEASVAEVVAQLGLTAGQVRVYDHRARRKLAAILARCGWL